MSKTNLTLLIIVLVIVVGGAMLLLVLTPKETQREDQLKIATTILPLKDMVQNVAGEQVKVNVLLAPGASPHLFEFSPGQLQELHGTQTIFAIGHGLDDWALAAQDAIEGVEVFEVDKGVDLRKTQDAHEDEDEHEDESANHKHGNTDPHYWLNFTNAQVIVQNIRDVLIQIDPVHAEDYQQNAQVYIDKLAQKKSELVLLLKPLQSRSMVTLHDAWYYFADDFDLKIVGTFEPTAGEEPTPQYLADLQETVQTNNVQVLFSEPQLSTQSIQSFLSDLNLEVAILDPLGGTEGRNTFLDLMEYNVRTVVEVLD